MDANNFAYWLNGFAELSGDNPPTKAQWKSIKEHLALVFTKVTPPIVVEKRGNEQIGIPMVPTDWPSITAPTRRQQTVKCQVGGTAPQTYC